jgi:hypothetical protein
MYILGYTVVVYCISLRRGVSVNEYYYYYFLYSERGFRQSFLRALQWDTKDINREKEVLGSLDSRDT